MLFLRALSVRAYASLVRMLFIRHATKYRADDLCVNLVCEYLCWMLGDPHFVFGRSLPFPIHSIVLKNKNKNLYVGSFNYFSFTIHIGSNWCMDKGVRDLEVAFLLPRGSLHILEAIEKFRFDGSTVRWFDGSTHRSH